MRMQIMTCRIGDEPPALVYVAEGTINNTGHTLPPCASGETHADNITGDEQVVQDQQPPAFASRGGLG
jgi:hypothetical protein